MVRLNELEKGMVVQINQEYPELFGCLAIVDEIHTSYIRAYMPLPRYEGEEDKYPTHSFFLIAEEIELVGAAYYVYTTKEEE